MASPGFRTSEPCSAIDDPDKMIPEVGVKIAGEIGKDPPPAGRWTSRAPTCKAAITADGPSDSAALSVTALGSVPA